MIYGLIFYFNDKVSQILKYVELLAENYTGGDYGDVSSYYLARDFSDEFIDMFKRSKKEEIDDEVLTVNRSYVSERRAENLMKYGIISHC